MSDFDELLPAFIEESQQHLQSIEPDILALEQSGQNVDREVVNRIFRGVHSIKGASGFFGLHKISELSNVIENSLTLLRDGKIKASPELIDGLLKGVDSIRMMVDNVEESETFDINGELGHLQKLLEDAGGPQRTVAVAKKTSPDEAINDAVGKFHISENDIQHFVQKGLHLYAVKIFLDKDLKKKNRTPFAFIMNMEDLGQYVDSFLDIQSVTGLSDCLDSDLAFDFLFATNLKPEIVPEGLDINGEQVRSIDLDEFRKTLHKKEADAAEPPVAPEQSPPNSLNDSLNDREQQQITYNGQRTTDNRRIVQTEEKIRVGVSFLNDLVNLAGELVLGRNQLMQAALPLVKNTPGLNSVLQHISRVTSEMQEKIMQMRMQPISLVFSKFHRIVRTLARNHDKEVRLITCGEDVELDKSIIEGLSDPLTHLIRNAVDHGLELPDEREKSGKPRHGTIEIKASHQGGQVHLMVRDNGRGIDEKFIGRKALEKGLIRPDSLNEMSEKDRVRLIFLPGFSTVEKVTELSGRGVGMDVVMTNIEHLGGTVEVDTKVGKGTTITLILPLTLAIVSGLLIKAGEQFFILPEADTDELVRIKSEEIKTRVNIVQNARVLRLRDMLLPLVELNRVLGITPLSEDSRSADSEPPFPSADRELQKTDTEEAGTDVTKPLRILVVRHGSSRFGLIADSIESTEEIVVKPLPRYLKKMKTFSGVSILGNGTVSLILDVAGILRKAAVRHPENSKEAEASAGSAISPSEEEHVFLLFDNSTSERFAFPLELIRRIERVSASDIEHVRDRQFIQYHGKKLRLIFLEDYLPVSRPVRSPDDTICLIIPRHTEQPLAIVMNRVINTLQTVVQLDTETIMSPGLFGSAVLDGRITLIPDMYRLFEMAAPEWYGVGEAARTCVSRKCRILLAEDTPFFRMVENEYLSSAGYEVILAENGRKALEILEEESVDAVILDIVMPKMDGWETIRAIRSDERLTHLPAMAITSLSDEGLAEKGIQAGFNEWELKLNKTRLLEKLAKMMMRNA